MNNIPRLVIAGTQSGCGKTTVAAGLAASFLEDGYHIQPYTTGNDRQTAETLSLLCERETCHLDASACTPDFLVENFLLASRGADMAIVDGWKGFFDGASGLDMTSSTAHISKLIHAPVIFVMNISGIYGSAAAVMLGFKNFDRDVRIAGVILNRAQNGSHYKEVKKAVEFYSGIEVLGHIDEDSGLYVNMPEIIINKETFTLFAEKVKTQIAAHVDVEKITNLATRTPELTLPLHIQNISSAAGT